MVITKDTSRNGADCVINFDEPVKMRSYAGVGRALGAELWVFVTFDTRNCCFLAEAQATARVDVPTRIHCLLSCRTVSCRLFLSMRRRNPKARWRTVVRQVGCRVKNVVTFWDPARPTSLISLVSDAARCGHLPVSELEPE